MRVPTLNSAPLAALFLIVAVIPATIPVTSRGLAVKVAVRPPGDCGHDRTVVVDVLRDGGLKLNTIDLKRGQLASVLYDIFKTRAEQVVFIRANPEVSFKQVAEVIDIASGQVDYVAILPNSLKLEPIFCLTIPVKPEEYRHPDRSGR